MTAWMQGLIGEGWGYLLATLIFILIIALPLMLAVAMIIYADRKIWAAMALRRGPNVVGPFGLLQSFADGLKVFLKETIIPSSANRGLFLSWGNWRHGLTSILVYFTSDAFLSALRVLPAPSLLSHSVAPAQTPVHPPAHRQ